MPASRSASDAAWEASVNVAEEIEVAGDGTPDPDLDLDIDLDLDLGLDLDHLEPAGPGNAQHEQHQESEESQEAQRLGQQTQGGDKDSGDREDSHGPVALNGHGVSGSGSSHENDEHRGHGTFTSLFHSFLRFNGADQFV